MKDADYAGALVQPGPNLLKHPDSRCFRSRINPRFAIPHLSQVLNIYLGVQSRSHILGTLSHPPLLPRNNATRGHWLMLWPRSHFNARSRIDHRHNLKLGRFMATHQASISLSKIWILGSGDW